MLSFPNILDLESFLHTTKCVKKIPKNLKMVGAHARVTWYIKSMEHIFAMNTGVAVQKTTP